MLVFYCPRFQYNERYDPGIRGQFCLLLAGYRLIGIDIGAMTYLLFCKIYGEYAGFPGVQ